MYPHRIRLRGPWDYQPLERLVTRPDGGAERQTDSLPGAGRMTMPCRWGDGGLGTFAGRVRFIRRFGRPRYLNEQERAWLTFAGVSGKADVTLNGQSLGSHDNDGPFEYEITPLLQERNELVVDVEAASDRGGLWGEAALEVRCTVFLRGVRAWREGARLHVAGEVAGNHETPLELYVLLNNATVHYRTLPAGESFHLSADLPAQGEAEQAVRVELVNGATVWYQVEPPVA